MVIDSADPSAEFAPDTSESRSFALVGSPQSKFLRRLPVMLYRLGFSPLLGIMPLLILTTRSASGELRYTPLEYRRHGSRIYVLATGRSARWLNRVLCDPVVSVRIGLHAFPAAANVVSDEAEAVRALFQFRMNAPVPLRWMYWSGRNRGMVLPEQFKDAARRYTFVRLEPLSERAMAIPGVPADRAWLWLLIGGLFAALAFFSRKRSL